MRFGEKPIHLEVPLLSKNACLKKELRSDSGENR